MKSLLSSPIANGPESVVVGHLAAPGLLGRALPDTSPFSRTSHNGKTALEYQDGDILIDHCNPDPIFQAVASLLFTSPLSAHFLSRTNVVCSLVPRLLADLRASIYTVRPKIYFDSRSRGDKKKKDSYLHSHSLFKAPKKASSRHNSSFADRIIVTSPSPPT